MRQGKNGGQGYGSTGSERGSRRRDTGETESRMSREVPVEAPGRSSRAAGNSGDARRHRGGSPKLLSFPRGEVTLASWVAHVVHLFPILECRPLRLGPQSSQP